MFEIENPSRAARSLTRRRLPFAGGTIVLVLGVLFLLTSFPTSPFPNPTSRAPILAQEPPGNRTQATTSSAACSGALGSSVARGTVSSRGGPSPPVLAGLSVSYSGNIQKMTRINGIMAYECYSSISGPVSTTASPGGTANYSLKFVLPSSGCSGTSCTYYSGPYGPTSVVLSGAAAPYVVRNFGFNFTLDYALESTAFSTGTVASGTTGGPLNVTASAYTAEGDVSPVSSLSYSWSFSSAQNGWSFNGGSTFTGVRATLTAPSTATSAQVALVATGYYNGVKVTAVTSTLSVTAISTTAGQLYVAPAIDSGQSVVLNVVHALGAPGYTYHSLFYPLGSGQPVTGPCVASLDQGGLDELQCQMVVSYTNSGSSPLYYQPQAVVTNGYSPSSIMVNSAGILVYPLPMEALGGLPQDLYAGSTYAPTLNDTGGDAPYTYCYLPSLGGSNQCAPSTASTSHTFAVMYSTPGTYYPEFNATDSMGVTVSVARSEKVWAPFAIPSSGAFAPSLDLGQNTTLYAQVSGGALPMTVWWNDSSAGASLCAPSQVGSYGNYTCDITPDWEGAHDVTIQVRDAAGSLHTSTDSLQVNTPPGTVLVEARAGQSTATQGGTLQDETGLVTYLNTTFAGGTGPFHYAWVQGGVLLTSGNITGREFNFTWKWWVAGNYSLMFSVGDTQGFATNASLRVVVYPQLGSVAFGAEFSPVDPGVPDNLSVLSSGGVAPLVYSWSTGDGHTYSSTRPYYVYSWSAPQNYTVSLVVTDGTGFSRNFTATLQVSLPMAAPCGPLATPSPTEAGVSTRFTLACITGGTAPYDLTWDFGDGSTTATVGTSALHSFALPGNYTVFAKVRDAGGGYVVSQGSVVEVVSRVQVLLPSPGTLGCGLQENLNPIDVGRNESLCAVAVGGVAPYTYDWSVNGSALSTHFVTFSSPGNFTLLVTVTDAKGVVASQSETVQAVPSPNLSIDCVSPQLDVNQTERLTAVGSGGIGAPGAWNYTWSLKGTLAGSGPELNYTFSGPNGFTVPGDYRFTVLASDTSGFNVQSSVNVSLFADPVASLTLTHPSTDEAATDNATATLAGGVGPYQYDWSLQTPTGWSNHTTANSEIALPTSVVGSYLLTLRVNDTVGYLSPPVSVGYAVNGALTGNLTTSAGAQENASVVGEVIVAQLCLTQGGTGPYQYSINPNGTLPTAWFPLPSPSDCTRANLTYGSPGQVWVSSWIRDALNETFVTISSLQIVAATLPPLLSSNRSQVGVHSTCYVHAFEADPSAYISWALPPQDLVNSTTYPNGTVRLTPLVVGTYQIGAEAQATYQGNPLGGSLGANATLVALAGPAADLRVQVSTPSLVVGQNLSVTLKAFDRWGNPVGTYSHGFALAISGALSGGDGGPYVNYSGIAGLVQGGALVVPSIAWQNGTLTLEISQHRAGGEVYGFSGIGLPLVGGNVSSAATVSATWLPAVRNLRLQNPETVFQNSTQNDTVWNISDLFGNPVPGEAVWVNCTWGSYSESALSPVFSYHGSTYAWVNYTVLGSVGGTVQVVSEYGQPLLLPLHVAPPRLTLGVLPSTACSGIFCDVSVWWPLLLTGAVTILGTLLLLALRRRSGDTGGSDKPGKPGEGTEEVTEEELARDAANHESVAAYVAQHGPVLAAQIRSDLGTEDLSEAELNLHLMRLMSEGRIVTRSSDDPEKPLFVESERAAASRRERESPGQGAREISPVLDESALREHALQQAAEIGVDPPEDTGEELFESDED